MTALTTLAASAPTMSSREIAELTGSTHDNVLKTIRSLIGRGLVSGNETPYTHPQNGQTYFEHRLSFRDTMVVVSGYSAELRARIIDRWQTLEASAAAPAPAIPQSLPEALRLAADLADQVAATAAQLAIASPKAEALDRLAKADGSMCITDAAKALQMRPKDLFAWLQAHQWIYRRAGSAGWVAYQNRLQQGVLEHRVTTVERADGTEKVVERVLATPKGLARLAELVGA